MVRVQPGQGGGADRARCCCCSGCRVNRIRAPQNQQAGAGSRLSATDASGVPLPVMSVQYSRLRKGPPSPQTKGTRRGGVEEALPRRGPPGEQGHGESASHRARVNACHEGRFGTASPPTKAPGAAGNGANNARGYSPLVPHVNIRREPRGCLERAVFGTRLTHPCISLNRHHLRGLAIR
jgi:hypothetical protein